MKNSHNLTAQQRAQRIIETAIAVPNARVRAAAIQLADADTSSPGWWQAVDKLRSHMLSHGQVLDSEFWQTPLTPSATPMKVQAALAADETSNPTARLLVVIGIALALGYLLYSWGKSSAGKTDSRSRSRRYERFPGLLE